ncbi:MULTISPECIES: UvrD-helicase domain-containing protein [unclassified Bradyrhizobium]|nr:MULTISPECIES: UvrD-helicase domain-containing protein [unclassified Bradyrhizobium]
MKATEADIKIQEAIDHRASFLLDAGAGSGKTTSLIRALNYIRSSKRQELIANSQRVACITFTNVAKNEIVERTEGDPLFIVSTIHDFLWGAIKPFQNELKSAVIRLNGQLSSTSRKKRDPLELSDSLKRIDSISYSDRGGNFLEGRIFHDDLLSVAYIMFSEHPMLARLVAARYPFIFVDEYQDTNGKVISLLLDYVSKVKLPPVVGFFGDKMQSIYSDGVGELSEAHKASLVSIKKEENYRSSISVINVLNKIRSDIQQRPSGKNLLGAAVYLNLSSSNVDDIVMKAKSLVAESFGWASNEDDTRILFLTHRLIARKAGYGELWRTYNQRGGFLQDQFQAGEDETSRFLCNEIDDLIYLWKQGDVGSVISLLNLAKTIVASKNEKRRVHGALDSLVRTAELGTIRDVVRYVEENRLAVLPDRLREHLMSSDILKGEANEEEDKDKQFYESLLAVPFKEVATYHAVLQNNLPYSTKHGVKGDEFRTVLVILDDIGANWSQYSFSNLLANSDTSQDRLRRTRNLFYVSCSRAKEKLAIVDVGAPKNSQSVKDLFGEGNCIFA